MATFNKVILLGNVVRDPDLRVTPSGLSICSFSVATSRAYKSQDGTPKEETTFVDVTSFGKQADVVAKYFQKGKPIFLEGRLRLDEWQNNAGEKRSKMIVVLESFQFVGRASEGTQQDAVSKNEPMRYEKVETSKSKKEDSSFSSSSKDIDDDVPF